jgi:hypothetical protein
MGLLAQSSLIPGFASLLLLLTTSLTESSCKEMLAELNGQNGRFHYIGSHTHEIYKSNKIIRLHKISNGCEITCKYSIQWARAFLYLPNYLCIFQ